MRRSDLYALGAVGYYLLTATPVFDGSSVVEVLQKHMNATPDSPSQRLKQPVSAELERVLLKCLAKNPDGRPQNATELADELAKCPTASSWTRQDAQQWWQSQFSALGKATTHPETAKASLEATQMLDDKNAEPASTQT